MPVQALSCFAFVAVPRRLDRIVQPLAHYIALFRRLFEQAPIYLSLVSPPPFSHHLTPVLVSIFRGAPKLGRHKAGRPNARRAPTRLHASLSKRKGAKSKCGGRGELNGLGGLKVVVKKKETLIHSRRPSCTSLSLSLLLVLPSAHERNDRDCLRRVPPASLRLFLEVDRDTLQTDLSTPQV